jgi:hypothetical protein
MPKKGTILIAGSLAQRPGHGGHAWVFLQYLLGFRRLGYEPVFIDWLGESMCSDADGKPCRIEDSVQARHFHEVMKNHGLENSCSLLFENSKQTIGLPRAELVDRAARGVCLINVMGFLTDPEILAAVPIRAFLDIDPGFGQMWCAAGLASIFAGHDRFVTIGENIGRAGCTIPDCGLRWITTPQPVVLEHWPVATGAHDGKITSIASWRGPFGPVDFGGRTYGLRVHEFRKFATLPQLFDGSFELALDIHPAELNDLAMLRENGWALINPRDAAGNPALYQRYIQHSKAELMIAKNMYVATRGGWFSDRSICYLASGRPVIAQETGWTKNQPAGEGLLAFSTPEEAVAALESVRANEPRHTRAARAIAEEHFDSDKVLARLLEKLDAA